METIAASPRKKIGVCISGGGAKIGFAVGVLEVMLDKGIEIDLAYGISAGSLCTAGLCYGGRDCGVPFLRDTLLGIRKRSNVFKKQWFWALLTLWPGWGKADGWFEMDTMRRKLNTLPLDKPTMRGVVGYVKLKSGEIEYKSCDPNPQQSVSKQDFLDAVQASCSIPAAMQSQRYGTDNYVDGGVIDVLPLRRLLQDPLQVSEVHVICLSPLPTPPTDKTFKNILQVGERSVDLMVDTAFKNDLEYAKRINNLLDDYQRFAGSGLHTLLAGSALKKWLSDKRKIDFFIYEPKDIICDTFDFQTKTIQAGIEYGQNTAREILAHYPNH
jgi:predicted acylesterase/phospholipase RssA